MNTNNRMNWTPARRKKKDNQKIK